MEATTDDDGNSNSNSNSHSDSNSNSNPNPNPNPNPNHNHNSNHKYNYSQTTIIIGAFTLVLLLLSVLFIIMNENNNNNGITFNTLIIMILKYNEIIQNHGLFLLCLTTIIIFVIVMVSVMIFCHISCINTQQPYLFTLACIWFFYLRAICVTIVRTIISMIYTTLHCIWVYCILVLCLLCKKCFMLVNKTNDLKIIMNNDYDGAELTHNILMSSMIH